MLSLLIIVLIAAIVFFQAIHGLFNALIMALCTLVCTLLAFTYYEPLAKLAGLYSTQPAYGEAIMLVALMVIPLFVLRFLVDNYLPGNVVPGVWVDRVGGAIFGTVTALLLVGTLVIAMQMLPFDQAILGWEPYKTDLTEGNALIIDAPAFTRGVVRTLSAGSMGGRSFSSVHENLRLELWAVRNRDQGARTDSPPDGIRLLSVTDITRLPMPDKDSATYGTGAPPYPGVDLADSRVYLVRVEAGWTSRDTDGQWRLRGTHFRLVTDDGEGYFPVGYLVYAGQWQVIDKPNIGDLQVTRGSQGVKALTADLLFRVPLKEGKEPSLSHLAFRRSVRMPVRGARAAKALEDMPDVAQALTRKEVHGEVAVTGGRGAPAVFRPTKAVVSSVSPVRATRPMDRASTVDRQGNGHVRLGPGPAFDADLVRDTLEVGYMEGVVSQLDELHGNIREYMPIDRLTVPQGKQVVQLEGRALGQMSMASLLRPSAIVQARVHLMDGSAIPMVGAWVKWTENNVEHAYLYYNAKRLDDPNLDFEAFPEREAIKALELYKQHLSSVTDVGLLFLVPGDAQVMSFNIAGGERFRCESPLSVQRASGRRR